MMCSTEQNKLKITKKDLIELLEQYDDDAIIMISVIVEFKKDDEIE